MTFENEFEEAIYKDVFNEAESDYDYFLRRKKELETSRLWHIEYENGKTVVYATKDPITREAVARLYKDSGFKTIKNYEKLPRNGNL